MSVRDTTRAMNGEDMDGTDLGLRIPGTEVAERIHHFEHLAFWQPRGSSRVVCGRQCIELRENHVLWVPNGTPHTLTVRPDSILVPLFFPVREFSTAIDRLAVIEVGDDGETLLLAMFATQNSAIQIDAEIERKVIAMLEDRMLFREDLPMPTSERAAAVANALIANPGDPRQVRDWAEELCVSTRSLERDFVRETGLTIRQWRTQCRMLTARRLLREELGVGNVATRVGYESLSSFSRAYRAFFDERPSVTLERQRAELREGNNSLRQPVDPSHSRTSS